MTAIPVIYRSMKTLSDGTARLTLDVEPMHIGDVTDLFVKDGPGSEGALARLKDGRSQVQPSAGDEGGEPEGHGMFWRDLIASGFFNAPPVCYEIMSDTSYQIAVRSMKSCVSKKEPCVYAHVRRASNSGTSVKPFYSGVPLTAEEHSGMQHQGGELQLLNNTLWRAEPRRDFAEAKDWFDKKAASIRADIMSESLACILAPGCNSRTEVPPWIVFEWINNNMLLHFVSSKIKEVWAKSN